jgi:putative membrane protein
MKTRLGPEIGLFGASAAAVALALSPTLHDAAEELFALHMVQHLLLVNVAAPLLAAGLARPTFFALLPAVLRRLTGRGLRRARRLRAPIGVVAVPVLLMHVVVLWAWHAPVLYEAALRTPFLHALEHVSLLVTAAAFWSIVLHRGHAQPAMAAALLYVFAAAGQSTALGALLTLSEHPVYAIHAGTVGRWGLSPLEDQQLAGLAMWVFGGLGYLVAALAILAAGLRDERGHSHARRAAGSRIHGAIVLAAFILAGAACSGERTASVTDEGDATRGREAFARYGCGACHHIPGVPGARGITGPSLHGLAARPYIAGRLPNDPGNLVAWIRRPRVIDPQTIMPDLAVSDDDARDMAAFFYAERR